MTPSSGQNSATAPVEPDAMIDAPPTRTALWKLESAWRAYRRDTASVIALAFLLLIVVLTLLAPVISPYAPDEAVTFRHAAPGAEGLILGADGDGRDVLSRLLWGGRISLLIATIPSLFALAISLVLGIIAGYFGGWLDQLMMRILDMFLAFPLVLLAIVIANMLSSGLITVMIAILIALIPYITRLVRTTTQSVKVQPFIEAAKAGGASEWIIIKRYVLPNVLAPALVYTTTLMGLMMVVGAGLSFLGLGSQPPTADWGVMVADGRIVLSRAPHVTIFPGLVIVLVALSFAFIGDGLRDALDPRTRQRSARRRSQGSNETRS